MPLFSLYTHQSPNPESSPPGYPEVKQDTMAMMLRRERYLQGLADATCVLLQQPNLAAAFPRALESLRQALEVERLYLCEHQWVVRSDEGGQSEVGFCLRCEQIDDSGLSAAAGPALRIAPTVGLEKPQSYGQLGLSRWYESFLAQEAIAGLSTEFPPEEQKLLQKAGVQSTLLLPIWVDQQELWGYIGCEDYQQPRVWSMTERTVLASLAQNLGSAIHRQRTEQKIQHQAFHDLLTGLPNRMLFHHRLPLAIAHARRAGEQLAVMFLDLDRFKGINDSLGHDVGDQLLIEATKRLQECLREEDILARWGGDEFTLCLPSLQSSQDVIQICQRLLAALRQPFAIADQTLEISGSIGIAIYPQDGTDLQTLLRNADTALYRVKESGRNHYQFFRPEMNSLMSERLTWEKELRRALDEQEFQLYYQPCVDLLSGQLCSLEALLRWQHPSRGLLTAEQFLSFAESTTMIVGLGEWILQSACDQLQQWQRAGFSVQQVAVNLSPRQVQASGFLERFQQTLAIAQIHPQQLALEVTESSLRKHPQQMISLLQALRSHGTPLVLDRFGRGSMSLEHLKQWPVQMLKIDRRLIQGLLMSGRSGQQDRAIVSSLLALSQGLGLMGVAQGIETAKQLAILRELNCTKGQGDYLCPPLSAEATTGFLANGGQVLLHSHS